MRPRCVATVSGLGLVGAYLLVLRPKYLRWGTTDQETCGPLLGDDLVPDPDLTSTRAITIRAPADQVWPWIAQLGQGRGGFYTYDFLENLVGCDIHSADRIVPAWQDVKIGDKVRLAPEVALQVAAVDPGRSLVLRGGVPMGNTPPPYDFSWAFVLREQPDGTTRLLVRERYGYTRWWAPLLIEPVEAISFLMHQRMLRGIRDRAEGVAVRADPSGPGRLERLSPLDVSNLRVEDHGLPMHVAALAVLEGAPLLDASGQLRLQGLLEHLEGRLHLAPRLRQILYRPRLGLGPPVWVDDSDFDIRRHVRARAIPAPGDEATLLEVCSELNEPPLRQSRPLWELWLLTGLAGGEVGVLIRLHHVVADGIAALALIGALLDVTPEAPVPVAPPWAPRPMPDAGQLLGDNLRQRTDAVMSALSRFRYPTMQVRRLLSVAGQVRQLLREGRAPRLSLNRPVGTHRRLLFVRAALSKAKELAHAHGAKVNDVVLTAIAGGARRLLEARGELKPGLVLKVSMATSIRRADDQQASGNLVGIMLAPLPVSEPDPIRRLEHIARATAERKRRPPYQPGARFAQRWMVRAMFHQRLVNLGASNLPGPAVPLYLAGAQVLEVFQIGVVQGNLTLSVGVLSYAGQLNFDVVGDADAVPDLATFADGLSATLEELGIGHEKSRFPAQGAPPPGTEFLPGVAGRGGR